MKLLSYRMNKLQLKGAFLIKLLLIIIIITTIFGNDLPDFGTEPTCDT